ncbi:hypothetical protein OG394_00750 [Kribbella sp. NBC_01245]|uniref:hypothetical protein n=1 Tax=Kribbella sp. NBC_01245 TaxID=2903578 RepID=UPI002E2DF3A2|nr:hypothetical protein [Kribbella sp. NBC_01245]
MGGNERLAALKRARERQRRIEAATARAIRAQTTVQRAVKTREASARKHDEKVNAAEQAVASAAADLARTCGSSDAAAEILGWSTRELRRITRTAVTPNAIRGADSRANGSTP